jgi:hypothetical protein
MVTGAASSSAVQTIIVAVRPRPGSVATEKISDSLAEPVNLN